MPGAPLKVKALDLAVRSAARIAKFRSGYYATSIIEMNRRQLIPLLQSMGYQDADTKARPTMPAKFPILGLDYAFHSPDIKLTNVDILQVDGASDHRALTFTTHI